MSLFDLCDDFEFSYLFGNVIYNHEIISIFLIKIFFSTTFL